MPATSWPPGSNDAQSSTMVNTKLTPLRTGGNAEASDPELNGCIEPDSTEGLQSLPMPSSVQESCWWCYRAE